MALQAIIFGSIGTLTETSHLQRAAFNTAFDEAGLGWHWSADDYTRLVVEGMSGGRMRIAEFARAAGTSIDADAIAALHQRKSVIFQDRLQRGGLTPNAGVGELLAAARAAGVRTAFASTTSAANIAAMFVATAPALTPAMFDVVTSADTVARGKPAPDVYIEVLRRLGVAAADAVAIEDTVQSLAAPLAAGIATLAVPGMIARAQDFGATPVAASVAAFGGLPAFAALLAR